VEVLALIAEQDAAIFHMADDAGALPLHECCRGVVDDFNVRFLVEQGGVGTLAARIKSRSVATPSFVWIYISVAPCNTIHDPVFLWIGGGADECRAIFIHDCGLRIIYSFYMCVIRTGPDESWFSFSNLIMIRSAHLLLMDFMVTNRTVRLASNPTTQAKIQTAVHDSIAHIPALW
jgi:hypothetical protein